MYTYILKENNTKNIPHWSTIYKFFNKLIKYDVIKSTYTATINHYRNKKANCNNNIYITDTTLIANKYGIDYISYNPQLLKHKTTKISTISDKAGKTLDVKIFNSNDNDSKILNTQLNNISFFKTNNKNILLGDAAYDSNIIRSKLKEINFGCLITPKNKRNCKNKEILNNYKLSKESKKKLTHRIKIEHSFAHLKAYKRINVRYDKYGYIFYNYILLAIIDHI